VKNKIEDIGFHYIDGDLQINLNKIFFKDVYETNGIEIAVDGYLILENNIEESLKQETLDKLHLMYKRSGIQFVRKIKSGKFNLIIYDKKLQKIFIVSDQFGCLPLYYTTNEPFMFSSNILNLPFSSMDWYAISQFLKYGHVLYNRTQDKNIKALPPHSILEYDISSNKYKLKHYTPEVTISTDVKKLFKNACDRLYTDEIEYALNLSGGCDSRFVLYNWKNKEDLTVLTWKAFSNLPNKVQSEDVVIAEKLTTNLKIKGHLFIERRIMDRASLEKLFKKANPFDVRKIDEPTNSPSRFKVLLTGDMAPVISGEFLFLRHKKFVLTALFGLRFPEVSKFIFDKAITRIPEDAPKKYLSPEIYRELTEVPIPWSNINVEDYHLYCRTRRWTRFSNFNRDKEGLLPFLDYELYFSCKHLKDRVNNKLYYHLLRKMPPEYKVKVTRYAFPLSYPRRLQFLTMIIKDVKRHLKPGLGHFEEIGGIIQQKPSIHDYMMSAVEEAEICTNIEDLSQKISGGKHGYFFFQLFLLSCWLNKIKKL